MNNNTEAVEAVFESLFRTKTQKRNSKHRDPWYKTPHATTVLFPCHDTTSGGHVVSRAFMRRLIKARAQAHHYNMVKKTNARCSANQVAAKKATRDAPAVAAPDALSDSMLSDYVSIRSAESAVKKQTLTELKAEIDRLSAKLASVLG